MSKTIQDRLRAAEAAMAEKQIERDAADLATYRTFRNLKDPKSPKFNPHVAAELANRDYGAIARGRAIDHDINIAEARTKSDETITAAVAAAFAKPPASGNTSAPPTAPPPAAA